MKKRVLIFLLLVSMLLSFCACSSEPVEVVKPMTDVETIKHLISNDMITNIVSADYERIYTAWMIMGRENSLGPTDPQFRGFVVISGDDAKAIKDAYEWSPVEDALLKESMITTEVDCTPYMDRSWYYCTDFTHDTFDIVLVNAVYFDGVNTIYFDVQRI